MASELDPPTAALLRSMAEAVSRAAPPDWLSAVLTCEVTTGWVTCELVCERPGALDRNCRVDLDVLALTEAADRLSDTGRAVVELTVRPSGDYQAVITRRDEHGPVSDVDCHIYVLDPAHRPPQPGQEQDGPADASPAGDPAEAVRLLREVMWLKYEIIGRTTAPRPPAPASRLDLLGRLAGTGLPADLLALYGVADGDPLMFNGYEWLSLEELLGTDGSPNLLEARERWWPGWRLGWDDTVLEADPPGTVRRVTGDPRWIPFAHDGGGNYLAADMAPGPAGRPGQIITIGRDYGEGPGYLADSVTGLLRMELDALRRGDYEAEEDDYIELFGPAWEQAAARNARERRIDARRATLASVGPEVQRLIVSHGAELDLRALRNAPRLHDARLTCRAPDLTPLQDLPVENLTLHTDTVDLSPLAGHPTLRTITLATRQPVHIAPLGTLPRLHGLHLAEAAVDDLDRLADLGGLQFLMLAPEQWRELRKRTDRLPPLAAAGLTGQVGREAVLDWAAGFPGFRPPVETRVTGRLAR